MNRYQMNMRVPLICLMVGSFVAPTLLIADTKVQFNITIKEIPPALMVDEAQVRTHIAIIKDCGIPTRK